MATDKDRLFEKIYFLWKGEGKKRNQSIEWHSERYGANIEESRKWFLGINHSVKEIQVVGRPRQTEALTGQEHFYFIPGCTDMRYGYLKLVEIVRHKFFGESKIKSMQTDGYNV